MATRKEQEVLQTNLRKWFNLLGYRVTETEVKVVTKNSRNVEFWRLLQKLILPGDDIKLIRSKLAGYQRKQDYSKIKQDVVSLQQRKEELRAKIAASKAGASQSANAINSLKTKTKTNSNTKNQQLSQMSTVSMRDILQKSLTAHCSSVQSKFSESGNKLQAATNKRTSSSGGSAILLSGTKGIETPCSRAVESVLEKIRNYLKVHISDSPVDTEAKKCVWDAAARVYSDFSPEDLVETLKGITEDASSSLINISETLSISKDLESLAFELKDGSLISKGDEHDVEKDLETHAIAFQNKVSKEWIAMLDNRNKTSELEKTVKMLQGELERNVQCLNWPSDQKYALSALMKFKLREKELDSKEATLGSQIKRLQDEKDAATKQKIQTIKTHQSIMDFKRNQEKKQSVIKTLVMQTGSLQSELTGQTDDAAAFISENLLPLKDNLTPHLDSVKSYPLSLSSCLSQIPLDRLHLSRLPSGSCPVTDLSIYQFQHSSNYHTLLQETSLPLHLESDTLLERVSSLVAGASSSHMAAAVLNNMVTCHGSEVPDSEGVFEALREALVDFDTFTSKHILDKIRKSEEKIQSAMKKCPSIKRSIVEFADQPAQHLVPWVEVEGRSLRECREKWTVKSSLS